MAVIPYNNSCYSNLLCGILLILIMICDYSVQYYDVKGNFYRSIFCEFAMYYISILQINKFKALLYVCISFSGLIFFFFPTHYFWFVRFIYYLFFLIAHHSFSLPAYQIS